MTSSSSSSPRVATIDVMRAIIMALMLFVNDIPGVKSLPHWLGHAATEEDMLGFSDIVFPGFLFCVGMSIPFAVQSRLRRASGDVLAVLRHVAERWAALVVMGLFTLNACKTGLFMLLTTVGFFLVWLNYDKGPDALKGVPSKVLKAAGAVLLFGIMVYYDGIGKPFHTGWWGILGLIGWAYLVAAVLYLATRRRFAHIVCAWVAVLALSVVNAQGGIIPDEYFSRNVLLPFWPGGWTHPALVMSGVVTSVLLTRMAKNGRSGGAIFAVFFALAAGAGALTLVCHRFWIISKDLATPTWLFLCLAIFFVVTPCLHWLVDEKGKAAWFRAIAPAGTATLTCYALPYIWYALKQMGEFHLLPPEWNVGLVGLAESAVFALAVIQVTRLLIKSRLLLKV